MGRKIPNVAKKSLQRAKCVVVAGANLLNLFQHFIKIPETLC